MTAADMRAAELERERLVGMPRWNVSSVPGKFCPHCGIRVRQISEHWMSRSTDWICEAAA